MRRIVCAGAAIAGMAICALPTRADLTFGGDARALAMGGAGLALADQPEKTSRFNPAALALLTRRTSLYIPNIGLRASGIDLDETYKRLGSGRLDADDAVELAREFGRRDADINLSADAGIRFQSIEVQANGFARARLLPNAAFRNWAESANGDVTRLTGAERADLLVAGVYALPAIGLGRRITLPDRPSDLLLGVRIKPLRAVYTHYIVDANNLQTDSAARPAPELGGDDYRSKSGVGVDVGILSLPRDGNGVSTALVVTNLIKPSLRFTGTDTNGATTGYNLQPTSLSLGSALRQGGAILAFDLVDINRAYGDAQARLGAEFKAGSIALRTGYSSQGGFTYGVGLGQFDLSFGKTLPLEVNQRLRF